MPETTYLESYEGGVHSFFEVLVDGKQLVIREGEVRGGEKRKRKNFSTPEEALSEATRLLREKLRIGFLPPSELDPEEAPDNRQEHFCTHSKLPEMGQAWRSGAPGEPSFPKEFEVSQSAVLQATNTKENHNKYYGVELHVTPNMWRIYTHYGRTDDLENNPDSGIRETRYYADLFSAEGAYNRLIREKTSKRKGYKPVNLASSRIGSNRAKGLSCGYLDASTLARKVNTNTPNNSELCPEVQALIASLYEEATTALTSTISAKITAQGIESPLGVLSLGQIERGELLLKQLQGAIFAQESSNIVTLSDTFYTTIPHRLGRSRAAVKAAVIDSFSDLSAKQETLQLMRDMLRVNGNGGVLHDADIQQKYNALGCKVRFIERGSFEFMNIKEHVESSQIDTDHIQVENIFALNRDGEDQRFPRNIGNEQLLFHGSRARNWMGILARGILMPRVVVSMGLSRTDAGWLGHGIYFGDAADTALYYTTPGRRRTRFMALANVALGARERYHKITYGISKPAPGYDSCHGVRNANHLHSHFADDEFVIYQDKQQQLKYLVEFSL